jgi:hypothetical protein
MSSLPNSLWIHLACWRLFQLRFFSNLHIHWILGRPRWLSLSASVPTPYRFLLTKKTGETSGKQQWLCFAKGLLRSRSTSFLTANTVKDKCLLPGNALEIQLLQEASVGLASGEGVRIAARGVPFRIALGLFKLKGRRLLNRSIVWDFV